MEITIIIAQNRHLKVPLKIIQKQNKNHTDVNGPKTTNKITESLASSQQKQKKLSKCQNLMGLLIEEIANVQLLVKCYDNKMVRSPGWPTKKIKKYGLKTFWVK